MTEEQKDEIRKFLREELPKVLADLFGRSIVQIKRFFISNIK